MSLAELSVNFFVALFALIDPVGNVPLFAAATVGATAAGRRRLADAARDQVAHAQPIAQVDQILLG